MKKIKVAPLLPNKVVAEEISPTRAKIVAYPFESGYAITLAHPLRRLLLGSSIGYAPISLKIEGATHEFDSLRGMHEDIAVFIINLKKIRFKIKDELDRAVVSFSFKGPKVVLAGDLENDSIEVVNKDVVLANLNEDGELNFTLEIAKGMGYVPSEDLRESIDSSAIALDAFFTPVRKANYTIENTLHEDSADFEKIVFDIETDGQISPINAFGNALETMNAQLAIFKDVLNLDYNTASVSENTNAEMKNLTKPINILGFSARSFNCLDRAGVKYLGEIVLMDESELKDIKNLGRRSLEEIKDVLKEHGFGDDYELRDDVRLSLSKRIKQLKEIKG
jgi:DNA-directed RNA polymerase subunit alpha